MSFDRRRDRRCAPSSWLSCRFFPSGLPAPRRCGKRPRRHRRRVRRARRPHKDQWHQLLLCHDRPWVSGHPFAWWPLSNSDYWGNQSKALPGVTSSLSWIAAAKPQHGQRSPLRLRFHGGRRDRAARYVAHREGRRAGLEQRRHPRPKSRHPSPRPCRQGVCVRHKHVWRTGGSGKGASLHALHRPRQRQIRETVRNAKGL